jgi:NFACT protein C-terminal domain/Heterogeneous nuclear ribonucleoprotein Q acidic domain
VSKTAPTGEFLPTGSFMIYGKKNFLSPMPLEMGFGIMFRLDDGSVTRHAGERKDRSTMCDETESVLSEAASRYGIEYGGLGLREVDTDDEGEGSGCGDDELGNDSSGEEGEEEEAKEDGPKAVSIAAFQLTSIAEASDADAEDNEAVETDIDARIENDLVPAVAGMGGAAQLPTDPTGSDVPKGGSSRLSARDRRLAKKMKVKGATVEAPVTPPAADAQDTGDDEHEDDAGDTEEAEEEEEEEEEVETRPPFPKGASKANSKNVSSSEDHSQKKGKAASSKDKVPPTPPPSKKKFVNKKKARRYAGQDGDEKELAMLALGHVQSGEKYGAKEQILKNEKEQKDRVIRQERAGIRLVKDKWSDLMLLLLPGVRVVIEDMVSSSLLKEGELDGQEIRTLATFSEKDALAVIDLFRDGENLSKVGNRSGFLAGIMRRFSKDAQAAAVSSKAVSSSSKVRSTDALTSDDEAGVSSGTTAPDDTDSAIQGESAMSRRDRKKQEQLEIQNILDEEGILDEEEGKQADEIDKLTGKPTTEDVLLYAVPVCGPYSAIRSFKYSVKLTPGTMKKGTANDILHICRVVSVCFIIFRFLDKRTHSCYVIGKAAKQAIDVFTRGKECSATEKALMRSLTDPEMVAIMIGDIKLSMPGLYQVQRAKKGKR